MCGDRSSIATIEFEVRIPAELKYVEGVQEQENFCVHEFSHVMLLESDQELLRRVFVRGFLSRFSAVLRCFQLPSMGSQSGGNVNRQGFLMKI